MTKSTMTATQLLNSIKSQAQRAVYDERDDSAYFEQFHWVKDVSIRERSLIERAVIRVAVRDILAAGAGKAQEFHDLTGGNGYYCISIYDGEEYPIKESRDLDKIMANIGQCDEETIEVRHATDDGTSGIKLGSIYLVYGNEGWDVICDHTDSRAMHELLEGANKLAEELGNLV